MAWTSETDLGKGWTSYVQSSPADEGQSDAIDGRGITRIWWWHSDVAENAVIVQTNLNPTLAGAGGSWTSMADWSDAITLGEDHGSFKDINYIPPYFRFKNESGGSLANLIVFVKRSFTTT